MLYICQVYVTIARKNIFPKLFNPHPLLKAVDAVPSNLRPENANYPSLQVIGRRMVVEGRLAPAKAIGKFEGALSITIMLIY